jgi:glucose-6-phosphate isomerase
MTLPTYWEKTIHALRARVALDLRWMELQPELDARLAPELARAFSDLAALEAGEVANADEGRMVGHYWLRAPHLAPRGLGAEIEAALRGIRRFAAETLEAKAFDRLLVVGIGGSALGPDFLTDALGDRARGLTVLFADNTDPDGLDRVIARATPLARTLVAVISKSGTTPETFNGMVAVQKAYASAGLDFARHAVAVTMEGSFLHRLASGWRARFPMWDWVGGRTSVTGAVGLLPCALAGVDIDGLLAGAGAMDALTRVPSASDNPAALLALAWWGAGEGRGERAMVMLPYKDRLLLLSRYLQQLVMESVGKRLDRQGREVLQGLTVYGNKGSTDQHAYVQQLREGRSDFFATFIEVLEDGEVGGSASLEVKPGERVGDYLSGFLAGTRTALADMGRPSLTLTFERLDAPAIGALVALYERAVSIYASLIDVNAYHQPGVEAGKVAAGKLLQLQAALLARLAEGARGTADELAVACGADARDVFHILRHLAASGRVASAGDGLGRVFSASSRA